MRLTFTKIFRLVKKNSRISYNMPYIENEVFKYKWGAKTSFIPTLTR